MPSVTETNEGEIAVFVEVIALVGIGKIAVVMKNAVFLTVFIGKSDRFAIDFKCLFGWDLMIEIFCWLFGNGEDVKDFFASARK